MAVYGGPDIVTDGLVLHLDAANDKSYDPVVEDCSLVLNMEGSNGSTTFTDGSKYGHSVTANGNAQISTGNSRFGASSAYFDGNGDYLFISNNSVFNLESSDFTIEANVFLTGYAQNNQGYYQSMIFCKDDFGLRSYTLQIGGTSNSWTSVNFTLFVTNTNASGYSASFNFELNRWYHIAAVRKGQSIRIYVDGIDTGGGTAVNPQTTSANLHIGGYGAASGFNSYGYYYNHPGYIDSLRVIKGKALYTENFTPPKKSFPEYKWGDLSGNENNGTFFNGVAYGNDNYGVMSFDGVNDVVSLPISNNLRNTSYTISVFMNSNINIQNGTSERYFYYFKGTTTGFNRFGVLFGFSVNSTGNNGELSLVIGNGGWNTYSTSQSSWASNTWYNLTVTQSGSSYKFYVNGLLVNSGTAVTPVFSGMEFNNSGTFWNGKFTPLLVYNKALSASEVLHNYNSLKKRFGL